MNYIKDLNKSDKDILYNFFKKCKLRFGFDEFWHLFYTYQIDDSTGQFIEKFLLKHKIVSVKHGNIYRYFEVNDKKMERLERQLKNRNKNWFIKLLNL